MTIKAIETRYNGYRFRSRLEARWAVFFDALGLNWSYEEEGYNLGEVLYLPDFCIYGERGLNDNNEIAQEKRFIEVKPGNVVSAEEWNKCVLLSCLSGCEVYILLGGPLNEEIWRISPSYLSELPPFLEGVRGIYRPYETEESLWTECINCGDIDIHSYGMIAEELAKYDSKLGFCWSCKTGKRDSAGVQLLTAYEAARSARFEHGEKPRVPRGKPR